MNLRQFVKYLLWRDTTFKGEYRAIRRLLPPDCPRSIVDVGANDGFYASNSYPFVARGWRAVLIEPHPDAFRRLKQRHRHRPHVRCVNAACGPEAARLPLWVRADGDSTLATLRPQNHPDHPENAPHRSIEVDVMRLDTILTEAGFPQDFGVLTVDAEGFDEQVLRGLDLKTWRPRLIITEEAQVPSATKAAHLEEMGYINRGRVTDNSVWTSSQP